MAANTDLAREYLKEHADLPKRTLAKMLRQDHPEVYSSIESARSAIRYATGNNGKRQMEKIPPEDRQPPGDQTNWTLAIPPGQRSGTKPLLVPPGKTLVLSDIHVPYHCEDVIELAVKTGIDRGCDQLYLNGDTIDFYKLSRFVKDPRERSTFEEVGMVRELLKEIGRNFKGDKFYKCGNHDERWEIYLWTRAEEFADFEEFELPSVMRLREHGFRYVKSKQRALMGGLNVLHGHELPRGISTPVNPARNVFMRLKDTALVGHWHQSSQQNESRPLKKQVSSCWSTGCLCGLEPDYMPLNNWCHGFAIVEHGRQGFQVENFLIQDGEVFTI